MKKATHKHEILGGSNGTVVSTNTTQDTRTAVKLVLLGGDSGSGKTTMVESLRQVLGILQPHDNFTIRALDGDSSHKYPRGAEERNETTHLNPLANDLKTEIIHLFSLKQGEPIMRRKYDHHDGIFTDPQEVASGDFIIYNGLHALYTPEKRELSDLSIFMDPDEMLRKHWKIYRDTQERGYTKERIINQIERRAEDKATYIDPQKHFADVIVSFYPKSPIPEERLGDPELALELNLKLRLKKDTTISDQELANILDELKKVETITIFHQFLNGTNNRQIVDVAGTISSEELGNIVAACAPQLARRIRHYPLQDNLHGIVQLFLLLTSYHKFAEEKPSSK